MDVGIEFMYMYHPDRSWFMIPLPSSRSLANAVWLIPSVIAATVTALQSENGPTDPVLLVESYIHPPWFTT